MAGVNEEVLLRTDELRCHSRSLLRGVGEVDGSIEEAPEKVAVQGWVREHILSHLLPSG